MVLDLLDQLEAPALLDLQVQPVQLDLLVLLVPMEE